MIKAEMKDNETIQVEIKGTLKGIYSELAHLMGKIHQAVTGLEGRDSADALIDSLAFLAKKSEEDADALKLFEEFVSERDNNK